MKYIIGIIYNNGCNFKNYKLLIKSIIIAKKVNNLIYLIDTLVLYMSPKYKEENPITYQHFGHIRKIR